MGAKLIGKYRYYIDFGDNERLKRTLIDIGLGMVRVGFELDWIIGSV